MIAPQGGAPTIGSSFPLSLYVVLVILLPSRPHLTPSRPLAAVPTHFAKVLICSRAPSSSSPLALVKSAGGAGAMGDGKEWVQGAFVLPNEAIPDEARLESFSVPGACWSSSVLEFSRQRTRSEKY